VSTDSVLDFLDHRALSGCRRSTIERYGEVLDRLSSDLSADPLDLTGTEIRRYLSAWQADRSPSGAAFVLRHLRAFYRWAEREGLTEHDPTAGIVVRAQTAPMRTATDEQVEHLLRVRGRTRKDVRDRAIVHLLVATGARRTEVGTLSVSDVVLDELLVTIPRSKSVPRFVPITNEAAVHLRRWLRVRPAKGTNLWASADGPALVGRVVLRRSGGALSPHDVRRWFATTWLSRGGSETSLARIMGWTSVAMASVYTRATGQQVAEAEYRRLIGGSYGGS